MGVLAYHMTGMHVIAFAFLRWTIPLSLIVDYNIQGVEKGVGGWAGEFPPSAKI